jgi:hypothetical protein
LRWRVRPSSQIRPDGVPPRARFLPSSTPSMDPPTHRWGCHGSPRASVSWTATALAPLSSSTSRRGRGSTPSAVRAPGATAGPSVRPGARRLTRPSSASPGCRRVRWDGGSSGPSVPPLSICARWPAGCSTVTSTASATPTAPGTTSAAPLSASKRERRLSTPTGGIWCAGSTPIVARQWPRPHPSCSPNWSPLGPRSDLAPSRARCDGKYC